MRVLFAALGLVVAANVHAQVRFAGRSMVDATLMRDVLSNVKRHGQARLRCGDIRTDVSEVLPADFHRPEPAE